MPLWPEFTVDASLRARELHVERFGEPMAVAFAPGTWTLLGELSDCFGGVVLVQNLERGAAVAVSPRKDPHFIVAYHQVGETGEHVCQEYSGTAPEGRATNIAERLAGLVATMMQRQLLSRDTAGFDITVYSELPVDAGLGEIEAVDSAAALAFGHAVEDRELAPTRLRFADVCFQSAHAHSPVPAIRARYASALRGGEGINVVDFADNAITQAASPFGGTEAFAVFRPGLGINPKQLFQCYRFVEEASKAFGAESLHLLPDAPTRVVDWLAAVHKVNGPEDQPSLEAASGWLVFMSEEITRATRASQAMRSRRHEDVFPVLNDSQARLAVQTGLCSTDVQLAELCLARGALSARSADPGVSTGVVAVVDRARAENFAADLAEDGLMVVHLHPGTVAEPS